MADRLNVLLLTADDMDGRTPGCCGGHPEATPRIDALAAEGALFRRAHVPIAVCQPSRSAILTGRWPHRNGAEGFEPIAAGVPVLTDLLRPLGYACGILGKVEHLAPVERFGWDLVRGHADLGAGRDPALYAAATDDLIATAGARPWFLMANAHDPHRPFHRSDQEAATFPAALRARIPAPSRTFTAEEVEVPGFLPDLEPVRQEVAEYLSSCRRCDDVVGAVLDAVGRAGALDRTLVVFLSDNGMALPFAKANCYLQSTATPLVVRWPAVTAAGSIVEGLVSCLDLFPTICEAVGADAGDVDGRSLGPLLRGDADAPRGPLVTVFHETAAKGRFEMRCIQDGRHGYVWNAWSDGTTRYEAENMSGRSWPAMRSAADADGGLSSRCDHYLHRRPEELFDLDVDPYGLDDLIDDPEHADVAERLRHALARWMHEVGDPLAVRYADEVVAAGRAGTTGRSDPVTG